MVYNSYLIYANSSSGSSVCFIVGFVCVIVIVGSVSNSSAIYVNSLGPICVIVGCVCVIVGSGCVIVGSVFFFRCFNWK